MQRYQMYIDGQWTDAASGEVFETVNPYDGQAWAQIPRGGAADAERAVTAAHAAYRHGEWSTLKPNARAALLRRLGDLVAEHAEALAAVEVRDNGKLHVEMLGQMRYLPQWYYYYAGMADKLEGRVLPVDKPDMFVYTRPSSLSAIPA